MDFFFFNERRTEGEKRTVKREEEHGQKHPGKREKDLEEKYDDEINANDTLFTTSGASSPKCDAYRAGERRISPPQSVHQPHCAARMIKPMAGQFHLSRIRTPG